MGTWFLASRPRKVMTWDSICFRMGLSALVTVGSGTAIVVGRVVATGAMLTLCGVDPATGCVGSGSVPVLPVVASAAATRARSTFNWDSCVWVWRSRFRLLTDVASNRPTRMQMAKLRHIAERAEG